MTDAANNEARMTFTEHLAELRYRIMVIGAVIFIAICVCYGFSKTLVRLVAQPLLPYTVEEEALDRSVDEDAQTAEAQPSAKADAPGPKWVTLTPIEGIMVRLKLSMYAGVLLTLPITLYQIGAFIFPGLKRGERRLVLTMLGGCGSLAIAGVCTAYFVIFPMVLMYLSELSPDFAEAQFRLSDTINMILMGLFAFALAFQMPMVLLILVYLDLLQPVTLKRFRKFAIVIIALAAALLTPAEPYSMVMMMIPLLILYEMTIPLSYLVVRRKKAAENAAR